MLYEKTPDRTSNDVTSTEVHSVEHKTGENLPTFRKIREEEERLRILKIKKCQQMIGDYDPEEDKILELPDID